MCVCKGCETSHPLLFLELNIYKIMSQVKTPQPNDVVQVSTGKKKWSELSADEKESYMRVKDAAHKRGLANKPKPKDAQAPAPSENGGNEDNEDN